MKKIALLTIVLLQFACKAQSPVLDIYDFNTDRGVYNAYYKDVTNFRDQYVGTWRYSFHTTLIEVKFIKKDMAFIEVGNLRYYKDYLIGGLRYVKDGVELVNTLPTLAVNGSSGYDYYLHTGSVIRPNYHDATCPDCAPDEKRLLLKYDELQTKNSKCLNSVFIIRRVVENGVEQLKVQFRQDGWDLCMPADNIHFNLPYGDYTLTKQ